jgi:hypothetical protein
MIHASLQESMFSAVTQISAPAHFCVYSKVSKIGENRSFFLEIDGFDRVRILQYIRFLLNSIDISAENRVKNGIRHQPNSSLPPVSSTLMTYHPQHSLCSTLSSRVRTRRAIHLLYFWERKNIGYHSFPNHNYVLCYRSNAHVSSQPPHHCLVLHPLQQSSCLRQVLILENRISGIMCHKRRAGSGLTSCTRLGPWSNFPSRIGCLWPSFNK